MNHKLTFAKNARKTPGVSFFRCLGFCVFVFIFLPLVTRAESVSVLLDSKASARAEFGAYQLAKAIKELGLELMVETNAAAASPDHRIIIAHSDASSVKRLVSTGMLKISPEKIGKEGFVIGIFFDSKVLAVVSDDDSGLFYGCQELARRLREAHKIPGDFQFASKPAMALRGTCVGLQKTYLLPGRKVYEYPITPELFPWFYDKQMWTEYLDFLAENRMNTLYLWSGHPFASLVRLKDYPYAVEVPEDVLQKNQETYRWLAGECDRRGIWLVQMFYNIIVSKPFAQTNGISTQLATPSAPADDYTRKSIAAFVQEYPNVGLLVCLGEALKGTESQLDWCTNVILPGVIEGMKEAGLKAEPPVVIRTHAMDPNAIMPVAYRLYANLYTETKYNGESLTTWEPRGKDQAVHLAMSKLGPHLVNIHILSNLEPFRYGDVDFIKKCVRASRDRLGASGIHLYPLAYWNWPESPDIAEPALLQWRRDWIWFEAWARYAWNPDIPDAEDHAYWIARLNSLYGNTGAAEKILEACDDAGEVAPRLIRRFGITEGNRQTLSLGMTLDQLVNPKAYGAIEDLWLSQSPPGERLDEFVKRDLNHEPHAGETPDSIIREVLDYSSNAVAAIEAASPLVVSNQDEFLRLRNDMLCIREMALNYSDKVRAAELVLRYNHSHDLRDMETAAEFLGKSFEDYQRLSDLAGKAYHFANSMQTAQRKIPVPGGSGGHPANFLWSQLVPTYKKELEDFTARVAKLRLSTNAPTVVTDPSVKTLTNSIFKVISTDAETFEVKVGARVFTDRDFTITGLAPELNGLTGIRFSHEAAKRGRNSPIEIEAARPFRVLIGYFNNSQKGWLQPPQLETAAQADERGGVDSLIQNAAAIKGCPNVDVHAFRFEAGKQALNPPGRGSFLILGVVPDSVEIHKRDAGIGANSQ